MESSVATPRGVVTIREARETDVEGFRALRLEALRNHPEAFGSDYAVNEKQPLEFWAGRLRGLGNTGMIYFATEHERLIGMSAIWRGDSPKTQHSAQITSVYVQPEWRGAQLAAKLIETCLDWARLQQITIAKLAVVSTNTAAIRSYSSCGFKIYGIEPQALCHAGVMSDELLMARSL